MDGKLEPRDHFPLLPAACKIAEARPEQSYMVAVPLAVFKVTALQLFATALSAAWLPVRVSPARRIPWLASAMIQRKRPERTSDASQLTVTELSRPEKPPSPATFELVVRIAAAALLWLETPIVPPPCALA
jgi:hypothetical protein